MAEEEALVFAPALSATVVAAAAAPMDDSLVVAGAATVVFGRSQKDSLWTCCECIRREK
jgi:hypothetical protein